MSVDLMRVPGFKDSILIVVTQVKWLGRPQDHIGWLAVIESDQRAVIPILVALYLRQAGYRVGLSHRLIPGAAVHEKVPRDTNFLGVDAALRRGKRQLLGSGGVHEVQDKSAHTAVNLFVAWRLVVPLGFGPAQHDGIVSPTVRLRSSEQDTVQLGAVHQPNRFVHGLPFLLLL